MLLKKLFFLIFLFSLSSACFSQKVYKKIAGEACECIKKKDLSALDSVAVMEEIGKCTATILYHGNELKKIGIDVLNSADAETATRNVMNEMTHECPAFLKVLASLMMPPAVKLPPLADPALCQAVSEGTFVDVGDTNQVITKTRNGQVITFVNTGHTARSKIEWISECKYKIIFIESDHPLASIMMDKNEVTLIEITGVEGNMINYKATWRGLEYESTMVKR